MIDRDYSLKMKSQYSPTKEEIIEFAYSRQLINNAQDWEIGVIYPIDNIKTVISLASDKNCPWDRCFLRCLYLFAGDFISGGYNVEKDEFKNILAYAKEFPSQDIKDWVQREEELFNNPEKYDYEYWGWRTKYLCSEYIPKKQTNYCHYLGDDLIVFFCNGKNRLMNKLGEIITEVEYDHINVFEEGIALIINLWKLNCNNVRVSAPWIFIHYAELLHFINSYCSKKWYGNEKIIINLNSD